MLKSGFAAVSAAASAHSSTLVPLGLGIAGSSVGSVLNGWPRAIGGDENNDLDPFLEEVTIHSKSFLEVLNSRLFLDASADFAYFERSLQGVLRRAETVFLNIDEDEVAHPEDLEESNDKLDYLVRSIHAHKFITRQIMEYCDKFKSVINTLVDENIPKFVVASEVMGKAYNEIDLVLIRFENSLKGNAKISIFHYNVQNLRRLLIQMAAKRIEVGLINLIQETKSRQLSEIDSKVCDAITKQVFTDKSFNNSREFLLDLMNYISHSRKAWVKVRNCNSHFADVYEHLEAAQEQVKHEVDRIIRSIQVVHSKDKNISALVDLFPESASSSSSSSLTSTARSTVVGNRNEDNFESDDSIGSNLVDGRMLVAVSAKKAGKTPAKRTPAKKTPGKATPTTGKRSRKSLSVQALETEDIDPEQPDILPSSKKNRSV